MLPNPGVRRNSSYDKIQEVLILSVYLYRSCAIEGYSEEASVVLHFAETNLPVEQ